MHTSSIVVLIAVGLGALGCEQETGSTSGCSNPTDPSSGETSSEPGASSSKQVANSLAAAIESIGMDYGASLEVKPVLLLEDGVACKCLDEDLDVVTLEDVKKRRPKAIGSWRAAGNEVEVHWGTRWEKLGFRTKALPLGDGWTTSKTYERVSSIGFAGTSSDVGAWKQIAFAADGRFKFIGGTTTQNSASSSKSQGSYSVSGLMMTLTFDDGKEERLSAVTGADAPGAVLWLSGYGYTKP
jgi:hypothetical protein